MNFSKGTSDIILLISFKRSFQIGSISFHYASLPSPIVALESLSLSGHFFIFHTALPLHSRIKR